ncbi:hypothetical protein DICPUDRAFT_147579 [Dictyostelium purpureum]|uniref:Protein-lysine N-methyltransferase DICPUDRAFT_147579 n=1 Tax=Dictyostelium purpureum TaxID=5786 RepID=F0Z8V4_DICPU|nr:uncharacterized protein DICPUDRAFT_147579 [Dictyostelium purpureum]EGC39609.1 hypothetical protein DICPUDRAFT_147579 [Dictyostelium purpureum]|eukprot:XP_003283830.1 hypothetical protein DICPUDRAFT_147579 [Dictyostelium purpureum]
MSMILKRKLKFDSSILGTKGHWDGAYDRELDCFDETGDVGEIWFGKSCLKTMVKAVSQLPELNKESKMIDLGCGNGMTLIELAKLGFKNLHGSDYSEKGIELAKKIRDQENFEFINYFIDDITKSNIQETFDVVLDKGTFDAIALSENRDEMKILYKQHVETILKSDGLFIITSCNYTENELKKYYTGDGDQSNFIYMTNVQYPVFKFGGSKGSTQTTLIFKKK